MVGLGPKDMSEAARQERKKELTYCLDRWRVQHFVARELVELTHKDWDGPSIVPPPGKLLTNIKYTVSFADNLREEWGGPVQVNSGYRPPLYNEIIGGADDSAHTYFYALDLVPVNGKIAKWHDFVQSKMKDYKGTAPDRPTGMGLYDWGVHIDINKRYAGYDKDRRWDNRELTLDAEDDE